MHEIDLDAFEARIEQSAVYCLRCLDESSTRAEATHRCEADDCHVELCAACADKHERATYHDLAPIDGVSVVDARAILAEARRLRAELAAKNAIINGRAEPPTDAEIAAHEGRWIATAGHAGGYAVHVVDAEWIVKFRASGRRGYIFHAWDDTAGRPCAFPVVSPTEKEST